MTELGSQTAVAGTGVRVPKQGQAADGEPGARRTWRDRIAAIFPQDLPRPSFARWWYWAVLAVVAGALISLGRVPSGPGVLNTIWAEDGSDFLTDALNRNIFKSILRPLNGYFVIVPRLLAVPASLVPIGWGPIVLTLEAAAVTGVMAVAVYLASRTYLRHRIARLIAAAPVLAVPVAENVAAGASNNVATLQFAAIYMGLWMVLWVPARRGARIATALAVLAVSVSTFLAVLLLPLAILRLYGRRDRTSAAMVGALLLGLVANMAALALHLTSRPVMLPSRYEPGWALRLAAEWGLPHSLFGYGISGKGDKAVDPAWLVWVAAAIVAVIVAIAVARLTSPQWKLAAVLAVSAVAMLCGTLMQYGGAELRYVIAPELMLFGALAALLLPRTDRSGWLAWTPLVALSVCVALVLSFSYRTAGPRTKMAAWSDSVAAARVVCRDPGNAAVYIYPGDGKVAPVLNGTALRRRPPGFPVRIPCHRLR